MCLIALALDMDRRFPLVVAANRDEFFSRPSARLAWWTPETGGPAILGGRDLEAGGTWLGLTTQGRLGLLTNVRNPAAVDALAPSRGRIVPEWLSAREPTDRFWMRSALSGYNGFNLLAADFARGECFWASNVAPYPTRLERGIHGVSNAQLDTPWPKVTQLKQQMAQALTRAESAEDLSEALFAALADRTVAADDVLPHTGVPQTLERALSAPFIRTADGQYGTRCSTVIVTERVRRRLVTHVLERTFSASGVALLRRSTLKDWPPRYTAAERRVEVEQSEVSETELCDAADGTTPAKRTRVRSLLKPAPKAKAR
ncbi:MAG: hypothetical protein RJA98_1042 [Pseudomonadota bacterium]